MTDVTRREAAEILGYGLSSLITIMHRQPDRWPPPIGTRRVKGQTALTYDLDALRAAASSEASSLTGASSLSDDDGLITCLDCGRRLRFLPPHLKTAHGVDAAEYRASHKLPATASMHADVTRRRLSASKRDELAADPHALDHLIEYQSPAHMAAMTAANRDAVKDSHRIDLAIEHRKHGRRKAVGAMNAAHRARSDATARAHGYDSADHAIEATRHLPAKAAARATGLGATTITRRRAQP